MLKKGCSKFSSERDRPSHGSEETAGLAGAVPLPETPGQSGSCGFVTRVACWTQAGDRLPVRISRRGARPERRRG